jgi:hypothetical protein
MEGDIHGTTTTLSDPVWCHGVLFWYTLEEVQQEERLAVLKTIAQ